MTIETGDKTMTVLKERFADDLEDARYMAMEDARAIVAAEHFENDEEKEERFEQLAEELFAENVRELEECLLDETA